ncbi:hypothetical protein N7501_010284 [Penicillium viridicatum]|nr:hypothetical protein N7501_010284 [Penicillium viridicatum]
MAESLVGQLEEYKTAAQNVEASLTSIDGIAAFALRKVMADIQKEADSVLAGEQSQPILPIGRGQPTSSGVGTGDVMLDLSGALSECLPYNDDIEREFEEFEVVGGEN